MNKKVLAGSLIILAAGIATFFYNKRRNKLNFISFHTNNNVNDIIGDMENKAQHSFS